MRAATTTFHSVHPKTGVHVFVAEGTEFEDKDEIVKLFPWAFESRVESATADPGVKRAVKPPVKKKPAKKK